MRLVRQLTRLRGPLAFWAVAGLALLGGHDAVYLVQIGPGERLVSALRGAEHGYWGVASVLLIAAAALAGCVALIRLASLRRRAHALGVAHASAGRLATLLPVWARLAAIVIGGFTIQENLEHVVAHGHVIGAGALIGPEYPLALPVLGLVTFVAAIGACLAVAGERALVAAIAAALLRIRRPERVAVRPAQQIPMRHGAVLSRSAAGRAPPSMLLLPG